MPEHFQRGHGRAKKNNYRNYRFCTGGPSENTSHGALLPSIRFYNYQRLNSTFSADCTSYFIHSCSTLVMFAQGLFLHGNQILQATPNPAHPVSASSTDTRSALKPGFRRKKESAHTKKCDTVALTMKISSKKYRLYPQKTAIRGLKPVPIIVCYFG